MLRLVLRSLGDLAGLLRDFAAQRSTFAALLCGSAAMQCEHLRERNDFARRLGAPQARRERFPVLRRRSAI
jgi:hypothetical protein